MAKVQKNPVEVYKFGGVAVGSAEAIQAAVRHVREGAPARLAVVVSAMNGVTDLLLDCAQAALRRDRPRYEAAAAEFASRHATLIPQLITARARTQELQELVAESTRDLLSMSESIAVLRELTPRAEDALVARGERLLATIFTAYLNAEGIAAEYVDAPDVIVTERRLGSLWPNFLRCERNAKRLVLPVLDQGRVVIMPGYLGSGPEGEVVTLGRSGSDFSAAILARSVGAAAVTLWKEVDGLMTADPKSVPSAHVLPELHYREAAELAYYGAKVLHPRTMIPLVDRKIPLFLRNT
ncbi:MAG: Aspartokinase, partial [Acidobacteria bacterium]|nr:Aspartokinase [Acidobacteriota bacterium]